MEKNAHLMVLLSLLDEVLYEVVRRRS